MNDRNSMDAEAWIFLATLVSLAAAYYVPIPPGLSRFIGAAVALIGLFFGCRYVYGDSKGRDWRGSFLPFAVSVAGLKLVFP